MHRTRAPPPPPRPGVHTCGTPPRGLHTGTWLCQRPHAPHNLAHAAPTPLSCAPAVRRRRLPPRLRPAASGLPAPCCAGRRPTAGARQSTRRHGGSGLQGGGGGRVGCLVWRYHPVGIIFNATASFPPLQRCAAVASSAPLAALRSRGVVECRALLALAPLAHRCSCILHPGSPTWEGHRVVQAGAGKRLQILACTQGTGALQACTTTSLRSLPMFSSPPLGSLPPSPQHASQGRRRASAQKGGQGWGKMRQPPAPAPAAHSSRQAHLQQAAPRR